MIRMAGEESPDWQEVARHGSILHGKLHEVSENYLKMDETLIFLLNMRHTSNFQVGSEVMLRIKEVSVDRKAIYAILVPSEATTAVSELGPLLRFSLILLMSLRKHLRNSILTSPEAQLILANWALSNSVDLTLIVSSFTSNEQRFNYRKRHPKVSKNLNCSSLGTSGLKYCLLDLFRLALEKILRISPDLFWTQLSRKVSPQSRFKRIVWKEKLFPNCR